MGNGLFLGIFFIIFGILIKKYKLVGLIRVFNERGKSTFADSEGLAKFCGNQLTILGVCLVLFSIFYNIFNPMIQSQAVLNMIELSEALLIILIVGITFLGIRRFERVDSLSPWMTHIQQKIFKGKN